MDIVSNEVSSKRKKQFREENESYGVNSETKETEECDSFPVVSHEMELRISHILEKIECFTQLVSELLESGKTMFKDLSTEFEERIIMIHKEQIDKWQEEVKELRLLGEANEGASTVLLGARHLMQNPPLTLPGERSYLTR